MRGVRGSEPDGIAGDCFWVLAMYGGERTAGELHALILRENSEGWPVPSPGQVVRGLCGLSRRRPGLVERAGVRWRVTAHGSAMLTVWCGGDGPERCGTGWPG